MGAAEESVLSGCPALGRVVARGSNDRRAPARMARIRDNSDPCWLPPSVPTRQDLGVPVGFCPCWRQRLIECRHNPLKYRHIAVYYAGPQMIAEPRIKKV